MTRPLSMLTMFTLLLAAASIGCAKEAAPPAGDSAAPAPPAAPAPAPLIDPNTATADELRALPGMDSAAVAVLIAGRPYGDMVAVNTALTPQTTEAERRALYERLFKPLDLNKATDAEMMLIPGVGPEMAHEFDEYRPYTDMARFRREIAKYRPDTTVARFERYVQIR